jgi:N-acetylneuraminate synthase
MTLSIDGRPIGADHPPYVIAEMSGNHNGDIERAFALIDAARAAGADAVKLQTYSADTITIDHHGPGFDIVGGLWDGRSLYELYQEASTPWDWHEALFERARRQGIGIFSSPFDPTAVDLLEKLAAPAYKIASFELIDLSLIDLCARTGKPLIMSTGMASDAEIAEAVATVRGAGNEQIVLLHCVSGYPTPVGESNIRRITRLAERFGMSIGLSDHTPGTTVPIAAIALGATVVEKHFTLCRADGGPDADFSLEPDELRQLVDGVRAAWQCLGDGDEKIKPSEAQSLQYRRSLYVVADVGAGEIFTAQNVRSIRPGFGLPPKEIAKVIGRRASRAVTRGSPLDWSMVAEQPGEG